MTLKEFREQRGLSQTELAERVGLKQTTISQYESGSRRPNLSMAKKIADALGMTLDDFACLSTFQNEINFIIHKGGEIENGKYNSKNLFQRIL
ncbi:MAG: helix-turn-helix transcriptional regulator [Ruminococcus flavefaciens]|nr:helix-turn-helix transcriptional regulator [Ruminococcus flavefaciens]